MKLIDKDALSAEIENIKSIEFNEKTSCDKHACMALDMVKEVIDTLEVKEENDLDNLFQALPEKISDEKSHQVYELSIYHYDGQCVVDYVGEIDHDSLYTFGGNTLYEVIEKAWNWLRKNSTGG